MTTHQSPPPLAVKAEAAALFSELESRIKGEVAKGMVDLKAMCSTDRDSITLNKLWTLNNVLRLAEGRRPDKVIDPAT
jgi:hypothetical protein